MDNSVLQYEGIVSYGIHNMYKRFTHSTVTFLKEDLEQEGWLAVFKGVDSYKEEYGVPLDKYLLYCVIRGMAHYVIREQKYQDRFTDSELDFVLDTSITRFTIGEYLGELDDSEKEVLEHLVKGKTVREISEVLQKRKETVIALVSSLKSKLKEIQE